MQLTEDIDEEDSRFMEQDAEQLFNNQLEQEREVGINLEGDLENDLMFEQNVVQPQFNTEQLVLDPFDRYFERQREENKQEMVQFAQNVVENVDMVGN